MKSQGVKADRGTYAASGKVGFAGKENKEIKHE